MAKRKLGRGLGALLGREAREASAGEQVLEVRIGEIKPNPWQPRTGGSDEALKGLVESIRANGVLQPIVLRRQGAQGYELVAGERRWRAAGKAGLKEVPAVVREVEDTEMLLLALLENIQREDLNAIERARGYAELMKNVGWTQEQLAKQMSVGRTTVANTVRLLELPEEIQDLVSRGTISAGHARALLPLRDAKAQRQLCRRISRESLSVRQVEEIVSSGGGERKSGGRTAKPTAPHVKELEQRFEKALGAKVRIKERKKGGRITIDFFTHDDFDRILAVVERSESSHEPSTDFHV